MLPSFALSNGQFDTSIIASQFLTMRKRTRVATVSAGVVISLIVLLWHFDARRSLKLPTGKGPAVATMGYGHGVIVASDGSLWVWGQQDLGWPALGMGYVEHQPFLKRLGKDRDWVDVAADTAHTLALKADGTIWAWGENHSWELGDGTKTMRSTMVPSVPGHDWKQVAAGLHGLALKKDGTLWAWGNNWAGSLGTGTTNNSAVPVQVGSSTNWVKVWAQGIQSAGLQSDGSLWWWGYQLLQFNNTPHFILEPTRLSADTNWVDVAMGFFKGFAIKSDGTLWAWGCDVDVFTGMPDSASNSVPHQVGTNHEWRACAFLGHGCVLLMKQDGSLWALDDALDQAGKRMNNPAWKMQPVTPSQIKLPAPVVAFAGSYGATGVALLSNGEVWTWGRVLGHPGIWLRLERDAGLFLSRIGIRSQLGQIQGRLGGVMRSEPWQLANVPP